MRLSTISLPLALLSLPAPVQADEAPPWALQGSWWAVGGQVNGILQTNTISGGPHDDALSFGFKRSLGWSTVVTLQGAVGLWKGASLVVMPEWADGAGLPNASGLAGYPDGDLERVSKVGIAPYVARAFFRQDIPLGDDPTDEAPTFEGRFSPSGPHLFAAGASRSRIELTIGKFAANDFFDNSAIASDPRHHFMNWALMAQGAWDFAADTRGYTYGVVAALSLPRFAARAGMALMPTTANGPDVEWNILRARAVMLELEGRWTISGRPGLLKVLGYGNWAHMGNYRVAIAAAGPSGVPEITSTEQDGALKYGGGILLEQELTPEAHAFLRAGANDGQTETFCFTEIDRDVEIGAEVSGAWWSRPTDRVGLAFATNGLSDAHADYLARGGKGFQLGDGSLKPGWEWVGELCYTYSPLPYVEISADVQGFMNPGMNRKRGPAAVFGLRAHLHI
jgi:high affinity Mn2+ porin